MVRHSGAVKLAVCDRLVDDWERLADVVEVPLNDRQRFGRGRGAAGVWEWLEQREQLERLGPALRKIGREDLVPLLACDDHAQHWQERTRSFTGRGTVIDEVAAWATASSAERQPVCFVTGGPGSGKSAVVGWFALDPETRRALPDAATRPRLPDDLVHAAVNAAELSTPQIVEALGAPGGTAVALRAVLRESAPGVLVVDALDEAADPADVLRTVVEQHILRAGPVGLLVAGRTHTIPRGYDPRRVLVIDLDDDDHADPDAVATYALRLLTDSGRPGTGRYRDAPVRAGRIAAAVAADAGASFLVAQLTCLALTERTDLPDDGRRYPRRVGDAMNYYLSALPDRAAVEDLLRPLALARGTGLPRPIWVQLAGRLSGTPGRYGEPDVAELLRGSAQALLRPSRAHGRTCYRLFHEALDEHLRGLPPVDPEAPAPGEEMAAAFARALLDTVPATTTGRRDWAAADPYPLAFLAQHAAGTPELGRLLHDAPYLVRADPAGVLRALPYAGAADRAAVLAYQHVALRLRPGDPAAVRAAYLALGARCGGDAAVARHWEIDGALRGSDALWWPTSARWRAVRSRVIHRHRAAVNAVRFAHVLGTAVVVSGSDDTTVGLTVLSGLSTAGDEIDDRAVVLGRPVRALDIAVVDHRPLVVAGSDDGNLHLVDLPGGTILDRSTNPDGPAVSALVIRHLPAADMAIAGYDDGTLRSWGLFPLTPSSTGTSADGGEIAAIVAPRGSDVMAATGSGDLWRWDGAGEATRVTLDAPPVTALGDGAPESGGSLVTGHADGSVRLWDLTTDGLRETFRALVPSVVVTVGSVLVDGRRLLIVGHEEGDVVVIDVATGTSPQSLSGHSSPLWDIAATVVGRTGSVVAGGEDDEVRLWALDGAERAEPDRTPLPIRLARAGDRLIGVEADGSGSFTLLDVQSGSPISGPHHAPAGHSLSCVEILAVDGAPWYVVGTDRGQFAGSPVSASPAWQRAATQDWVVAATLLDAGPTPTVLAVTTEGSVRVLRRGASAEPEITDLRLTGLDNVTAVAIDQDTGVLAAADRGGSLGCWEIGTGTSTRAPAPVTTSAIRALAWRSGSQIVGTHDGQVVALDGDQQTLLTGHRRRISRIVPLSRCIVTGSDDGTLRAWPDDRDVPATVIDLGAPITDVLARPDGSVAVATAGGVVVLDITGITG